MRGGRAAELVAVLILALGTWLGFATAGLPRIHPGRPGAFSTTRALQDLRDITTAPHPTGTAEHDRVRDYLVDRLRALGLSDVHVQSATGFNTLDGPIAATVANVVGRRRGAGRGPALLLTAHYDAVPRSFGAGDDGAAVAAILETLRVIGSEPPLDRDVIVVFSDAEEDGLLGAEAFVDLHPWARDVGVVLNFEGRGVAGPVYMFQTSPGNAPLIAALAKSVSSARTNSLTGEVYRHLPSDTDLSIWLHSGLAVGALNFAHVGGYTHYHTPVDNIASLDPRIVQQMGDYAVGLTNTLGRDATGNVRTSDAIYFNAPFVGVIHYPVSWALALSIDGLAILLVVVALGFRHRSLTLAGFGRGAAAFAVSLALPAVVTLGAWRIISALHPAYREILQRDPYNSRWYLLSVAAFAVAAAVEVQRRIGARASATALAAAPMLVWGILGVVVAATLPGASYLFAWPVFAAATMASWWRRAERDGHPPSVALALVALPLLVLWPPLIAALEVALTAQQLVLCAVLVAFVVSLLTLPLQLTGGARRVIARAALAVSIAALIGAEATAGFTESRKRPDSLAYVVDASTGRAWWTSFDRTPDEWTEHVLGKHPGRVPLAEFGGGDSLPAVAVAGPVVLPPSPVELLANSGTGGGRRVHLHIGRSGSGEYVMVRAARGAIVSAMIVNGRVLVDGTGDKYRPLYHAGATGTILTYYGVPEEGVDLQFTLAGAVPESIRVITSVEGLPSAASGPLPPRPPASMSKPFVPTDMTITAWSITP